MFSLADAHIAVCDPERLPGPEAVVRVADCARKIVKAPREREHYAPLLQVRLKDNANAAKPGVWLAAGHPADSELQLGVLTTVYHWLQAFHDLRWRGKPDRHIGATHWQDWLQADTQHGVIRSLGPAPGTRALDATVRGGALAPHTVPRANLPFDPPEGDTEPMKCPLCADKYYTSGAMLEHLAWHAVHAAPPGGRQGGGLPHPPREGTEVPVARPVRPAPPASGRQPRRRQGGGTLGGPRGGRCSPTRIHPRGTGPPGPPVGPAGGGLPTPHGPRTPRRPGGSSGPGGNADAGQLTPGGRGRKRPMAPLLEPTQRPCPTRRVIRDTLRRRRGPAACTDKEHLITGMLPREGGFAIMLQETGIATRAQEMHVDAALRDKGYTPFFSSQLAETVATSTSRGGGLLTAVSSKYVAEHEVLSFTEIVPGRAAALDIRTDGGGLTLINVHGPQAGCSPLAGRAAFWADIQMYATARSLGGTHPVVIAGDTNVYMGATTNRSTEHFPAGWEACGFRRATAGCAEDMTPPLHPSRHRVDTFLVNEPLLQCSLRESVWARGMAHPQVIGSDRSRST